MQDGPASRPDFIAPWVSVAVMVLEYRETEPEKAAIRLAGGYWSWWLDLTDHVVYTSDKQVVFVLIMHVERRPADIRSVKNLFDHDGVIRFLRE
jgi:hypothetical protein